MMRSTGKVWTWLMAVLGIAVSQGCFYADDYFDAPRTYRTSGYGNYGGYSSYSSYSDRPSSHGYRPRRSSSRRWQGENAGPRMGVIRVCGDAEETLQTEYGVDPTLTAWGWQWELQYSVDDDPDVPVALVEFVPLVAGLEQGQAFPSLNLLVGLRTPGGWEFCVGPNLSPSGAGMTVALGRTCDFGSMSIPVNLAYVGNEAGQRYSITFGWNLPQ